MHLQEAFVCRPPVLCSLSRKHFSCSFTCKNSKVRLRTSVCGENGRPISIANVSGMWHVNDSVSTVSCSPRAHLMPATDRDESGDIANDGESTLPPGAVNHPGATPRKTTSLELSLQTLRFGYEREPSGPVCGSLPRCIACPVRYRCARGHVVTALKNSPAAKGCPMCACRRQVWNPSVAGQPHSLRAKLTLENLREIAVERGGACLAIHYESARVPVQWACAFGHTWFASVDNVKSKGSWCPHCAKTNKRLNLQLMHQMAAEKGGYCLSTEYTSAAHKLHWRCAHGHEFMLAPNNIRRDSNGARKPSWCPHCRQSKPSVHTVPRRKTSSNITSLL